MNVQMNDVLKVHPDTGMQRVSGRWMAASPDEAMHTFLDEDGEVSWVAERILDLCNGQCTVTKMVETLCHEFDVSPEVCARDTIQFLEILLSKNILVVG